MYLSMTLRLLLAYRQLKQLKRQWALDTSPATRTRPDADALFFRDTLDRLRSRTRKRRRQASWTASDPVAPTDVRASDNRDSISIATSDDEYDQQARERHYLALYKRHLTALEAVAQTQAASEALKREKAALAREKLAVARDQYDLALFATLPAAEHDDGVASEFLALKRREACERLRRHVARHWRQTSSDPVSGASNDEAEVTVRPARSQLPLSTVASGLPSAAEQFSAVSSWSARQMAHRQAQESESS